MKESFYFPHDTTAHSDPKLVAILCDAGLAGLGMYRILIEIMHQQDDGMITEKQMKQYLRMYGTSDQQMFNTGGTFVEQMLNIFKTNDVFVFREDGKIFSKRVIANKKFRKDMIEKKSLAGIISGQNRRGKAETGTDVEQVFNGGGTQRQQGKERKGKEKKKKDNINTIPIGIDDVTVVDDQEEVQSEISSKKKRGRTEEQKIAVHSGIVELQQYCDSIGVAYKSEEERIFMNHILHAKSFGDHCEKIKMKRLEYAKNIVLASMKLPFLKGGVASGPKEIYLRHEDIFNEAQKQKGKKSESGGGGIAKPPSPSLPSEQ